MIGEPCEMCGNKYPIRRQLVNEGNFWICDRCGAADVSVPYVFWDGKPEINLADGPDGKPRVFLSRGQKARYLKERGIMEAGDRVHGAPFSAIRPRERVDHKPEIRGILKRWKEMGRDRQKEEYRKIIAQREISR